MVPAPVPFGSHWSRSEMRDYDKQTSVQKRGGCTYSLDSGANRPQLEIFGHCDRGCQIGAR